MITGVLLLVLSDDDDDEESVVREAAQKLKKVFAEALESGVAEDWRSVFELVDRSDTGVISQSDLSKASEEDPY